MDEVEYMAADLVSLMTGIGRDDIEIVVEMVEGPEGP
jgi:hypothetical protein